MQEIETKKTNVEYLEMFNTMGEKLSTLAGELEKFKGSVLLNEADERLAALAALTIKIDDSVCFAIHTNIKCAHLLKLSDELTPELTKFLEGVPAEFKKIEAEVRRFISKNLKLMKEYGYKTKRAEVLH